ncbi:TolC family protein [Asticcacaulis machinosus]|uniref:TolC family protein n=1 Tax=Asticcacaulis machinosus TaxID=2984211 RepID=A0ABT5HMG0_9CAUL|nr:TolC family protein [Asticcacaulis machinosus]MDC7677198.1 TolC family protein [Asticcacaulis machinosus]
MIFTIQPAPVRRRGRRVAALLFGACLMAFSGVGHAETLTLNEALSRASAHSPVLAAGLAREQAARAAADQAGVKPNPVVGFEVENLAGSGNYSMLDTSETTVYYEQKIERGGKRQARAAVARTEIDVVRLDTVIAQLDLMEAVEKAWVAVLEADAEINLAQDRLNIARQSEAEVMRRVKAARDPLFAGSHVQALTAQARLYLDNARLKSAEARRNLAAYWGEGGVDVSGQLENLSLPTDDVPPESTVEMQRLILMREVMTARLKSEMTASVQDINVRGGVRYFNEGRDAAFVIGGSIPLGRYDTNRGNIARVKAERAAIESDIEAERLAHLRERAQVLGRLHMARAEVVRIDHDILPLARKTLTQVREGFARGGFSPSDVTLAANALADVQARRLTLLTAFHLDMATLNRLDGRHAGLVALKDSQ